MDEQRKSLIDTFKMHEKDIKREITSGTVQYITKSATLSTELRNAGNELFKKKVHDAIDHEEIFRNYCYSIASAPLKSRELMLAYGNRSAILFHIKKYNECIKDIDRALEMSDSISFSIKLLCRKSECLIALDSLSESRSTLDEAKILLNNLENEKDRRTSETLISKVETACNNAKPKNKMKFDVKNIVFDETSDIYNSVSIKYTEKHGRTLVALRNYDPGEIIFVEKLYATVPDLTKSYKYCYHCLVSNFPGIPCENCQMVLFCSEECKTEAMKAYHDIECAVVFELTTKHGFTDQNFFFGIRLLIMGLKEVASFEKLKSILQSIDQKSDKSSLGLQTNEKYIQNFSSIYDLPSVSNNASRDELAYSAIICLILIAKKSNIFGDILHKGFKNFSENEDILFIGSLLIKLLEIIEANSRFSIDVVHSKCPHERKCRDNKCCRRGSCISPLASLLKHNCFANTTRCFTEDRKAVIFALHPIKKDDTLTDCYCSPFYMRKKTKRQKDLLCSNIVCDCQACVEDWPPLVLVYRQTSPNSTPLKSAEEITLFNENRKLMFNVVHDDFKYIARDISNLSTSINRAFEICSSPSLAACILVYAMRCALLSTYGLKEEKPFDQFCSKVKI